MYTFQQDVCTQSAQIGTSLSLVPSCIRQGRRSHRSYGSLNQHSAHNACAGTSNGKWPASVALSAEIVTVARLLATLLPAVLCASWAKRCSPAKPAPSIARAQSKKSLRLSLNWLIKRPRVTSDRSTEERLHAIQRGPGLPRELPALGVHGGPGRKGCSLHQIDVRAKVCKAERLHGLLRRNLGLVRAARGQQTCCGPAPGSLASLMACPPSVWKTYVAT